tara:strand:- start:377 stop:667 length:291 start_codon:yes stop_codon:yes gene_type:complete
MTPLPEIPYDEWFDNKKHPYDSWPVATDKTPIERLHDDMRKQYENPRPEEEIARLYEEGDAVKQETPHEKAYRLAVEKHSPWKGGGSENWHENTKH